jgi:zinc protease
MTTIASRPVSVDPASVEREVLPNGLTVLVRRDETAPVVAVVTHVKAGYYDESDDVVGIAHVLEHMYFKGTPTRGVGVIAKETKASGGFLNAATIYDHTVYYTVLPSSGLLAGLEIQADAYANSVIDAGELARELEVIIQEAKRKADNPSALTTETLFELLHDSHRMRRWRIGREAGLRRLSRDDLVRFYRNFYRPSSTILSIVGDIDVGEVFRHVRRLYGGLEAAPIVRDPGPAETSPDRFRYRELSGDIAQSELVFGWRTQPTMHDDTPMLDLAAGILGAGRASRLYRAVRERQLAASVSAYNYTPTDLGVFVIHADMPEASAIPAARAIWDVVRRCRDESVLPQEVARAQSVFESRWLRHLETMEGQANHLAEWEALGDWQLGDRYFERITAATAADVSAVAQRYLTAERAGWVMYRPASAPVVADDADAAYALLADATVAPLPPPPEVGEAARPSSPPRVALERQDGTVRIYRTAGGIPILVRRRPGAPIVHAGAYAIGGAASEPEALGGLATLLVRTSIKGTERRSAAAIAEESEMLGAVIGTSATADGLGWTISAPVGRVNPALDLLADVAQRPTFADDAIETERRVALANLAQQRDDMYRYPVRLAMQAAYGTHPYARSVLGTEQTLGAIDGRSLRAWHEQRVLRAPLVIAVAGDVEPDDVAAQVAWAFERLVIAPDQPLSAPRWPESPQVMAESRDKAQTALVLAFEGPPRRDPRRYATGLLAVVASGLGGRFFDELRDKQSLAYTVQAYASERVLAGTFISYIATSPDREEVARRGLLGEFAKFRDADVTPEELDRAKRYAIGARAIRQEGGGAALADLVDAWLYGSGLHEIDEHDQRIGAVTAADIRAVAAEFFIEERRVEGIVRGVPRVV